ncbi:MAG TPA: RagB/SusD family nutrient uptake outer membrane protein, partial [Puia sp.]|nr:RagB/SusD family nutrient uptake outer membrane protein [Puia sp.]
LMNYAEAENELGNIQDAYTQLIALRQRAGIQAGSDGKYGIPAGLSQSQMRTFIQNERFIEFAFENKRYWDLRRWKLASTVLNQVTHSMLITKLAKTPRTANGSDYSFQVVINDNDKTYPPSFQDKFYFLPLPQTQLLLNPKLAQNPLWQ